MPKFLVIGSYTAEGAGGVLAKGGSARREAVEKMVADLGGKIESFYFAFGHDDVFVTIDLPDNIAAAALGLAVGASGAIALRTVALLTPEEIDRASQVNVAYKKPGS